MQRCSKVDKYDAWISIDLHLTFIFSVSWSDLHFCKLSLLLYLGPRCFVQALSVCLLAVLSKLWPFVSFVLDLTVCRFCLFCPRLGRLAILSKPWPFVCFVLRLTWSYWKVWSQRGQPPHSFPSPREEKMLVIFCLRKFERRRLPKRMMMVDMIKVSSTCLSNLSLSAILSTICFFSWNKIKRTNFWQNVSQPV